MKGVRVALRGLTTRGRSLLACGLVLVAAAVLLGQRDLLRAGLLLLALPLCAVAVVARTRFRLSCSRALAPVRVPAGRPAEVRLSLVNLSRLPTGVLLVEDALPAALGPRQRFVLDRVEPQGTRTACYPVSAGVRGRYRVGPLVLRLSDPFGLCELPRAFPAVDDLVVVPTVAPLPAVRLGGQWAGGGDAVSRGVASSGTDDATTRQYRRGDDLRKVHWRSTARTGELMVRREEQPLTSRAVLLLDDRRDAHRGQGPASSFEWAVNAVASIGAALLRGGFAVRALRADGSELGPQGTPLTEGALLDSLAGATVAHTRGLHAPAGRLREGGLEGVLVAVVGALDAQQAEQLSRLRTGNRTCVAVVLDTDSWSPGSARARADAQAQVQAAQTLLSATGWRVLPVTHGTTLASVWPLAGGRAAPAPREVPA